MRHDKPENRIRKKTRKVINLQEWSPFRAYAARKGIFCWQDLLSILILTACACWLVYAAWNLPGYKWNWSSCLNFIWLQSPNGAWKPGLLVQGLFVTLRAGFWSFLLSLLAGGIAGFYAAGKPVRKLVPYQIVINLVRNTPPIILLFCAYLLVGMALPVASLENEIRKSPELIRLFFNLFIAPEGQLDKMLAAVCALGIYQAAYVAEIFRGSINGISSGQWDAGYALGFNRKQTLRFIILPQALRSALAPLTGQCVTTFKESSLASLISLPDLTFESLEIMATTGKTFEVWICAGLLYLALGLLCAFAGRKLERHFSRHLDNS